VTFLALIIALTLLQYWGSASPVHTDDWFYKLLGTLAGWGLSATLQFAVAVLLPALLVLWVQSLVAGMLFGAISLALMVFVLLYGFGRGDFEALVGQYREYCQRGDFEAAYLFAREEIPGEIEEKCSGSPEQLHRWMKEQICYMGFERWFGVIFYFAILGPAGALAYRLLHLYSELDDSPVPAEMVARVRYFVDWIPARLLVFAFALTGDWVGSREQVMTSLQDTTTANSAVIADAAHAALGLKATVFSDSNGDTEAFAEVGEWEINQLQSLLRRSAVAWVVVLSLLVLFV
jgi:AmpE protein